jgi:peptidyl-dipeptidase A
MKHPFEQFLEKFVPTVAHKTRQACLAVWILETTGSNDAAVLKADLDIELRLLYNDKETYERLLQWDQDPTLKDPLLKRELNVLIRAFKQNMIPRELVEEIARKEAALSQSYANFRAVFDGKPISENGVREQLKRENNPEKRKRVWEASKEIGDILAPQILSLVELRNRAAKSLGYSDYFQMQLDLQEVDGKWLIRTLEELAARSDEAYRAMKDDVDARLSKRFGVQAVGPWAWSDPFCQEDPLEKEDLDGLVQEIDFSAASTQFYKEMGIEVGPILKRSDMFEREGKTQHAFCINIDREGDVRTLNNVRPTIKWFETVLHELGHAIYEVGFDPKLPWLLREPPHMITTEAMALLAGRQAYRSEALKGLTGKQVPSTTDGGLKRRQLIFSRWVLVMTFFESELYKNPTQDLQKLWWHLVERFQMIAPPQGREAKNDWAAKYHIGLAPVYYFSYLLGEMFASSIEEAIHSLSNSRNLNSQRAGDFLNQKLFAPGNRMSWSALIEHVTGKPLDAADWLHQFANQ